MSDEHTRDASQQAPLSDDEIMALQAGPDLDARIRRDVVAPLRDGGLSTWPFHEDAFRPSEDDMSAFYVADLVICQQQSLIKFVLLSLGDEWIAQFEEGSRHLIASTRPLAICKAALRTVYQRHPAS